MENRNIFKTIIISIISILILLILAGCNNNKEQNNINITTQSKVEFSGNECLAIGCVLDEDLEEFKEKYFNSTENLKEYDFRNDASKKYEYGNRFVIIPKSDDVLISVYRYKLGEGEELIEIDKVLLDKHKGAFMLLNDEFEYIPNLCIKLEYNGVEKKFDIMFSGKDGTLVLTEVEDVVKDISIYKYI